MTISRLWKASCMGLQSAAIKCVVIVTSADGRIFGIDEGIVYDGIRLLRILGVRKSIVYTEMIGTDGRKNR